MLQSLLEKYNLKFEDLNSVERETLTTWLTSLAEKTLSVENIKDYITQMKDAVGAELAGYSEPKTLWEYLFRNRIDNYRRARLKNYLLLLAFLTGPDKARKAMEKSLSNFKPTNKLN